MKDPSHCISSCYDIESVYLKTSIGIRKTYTSIYFVRTWIFSLLGRLGRSSYKTNGPCPSDEAPRRTGGAWSRSRCLATGVLAVEDVKYTIFLVSLICKFVRPWNHNDQNAFSDKK